MDSSEVHTNPVNPSNRAGASSEIISNTDRSDDSLVHLNSKDELNWVENEVVVEDNVSGKVSVEVPFIDDTKDKGDDAKTVGSKVITAHDENEAKLWEYFTEYNSSQLRCNLCLGLFLYQSDASHLLRHVEAAHKIQVLSTSKMIDSGDQTSKPLINVTSSNNSTNIVQRSSSEDKMAGNSENKTSSDKLLSCSVKKGFCNSKTNDKVWEHFARLSSGKIRCNLCFRVLSYGSSEFTMLRHLNSNHRDIYLRIIEVVNDAGTKGTLENDFSGEKQNETVKQSVPPNEIWEYYKKVETPGKVQCKFCNILLKFTEGVSVNLIRHLKNKHKIVFDKENECERFVSNSNHNQEDLGSDLRGKDNSMIIFEIIQDGDDCLITNARLEAEHGLTSPTVLKNSSAPKLNSGYTDMSVDELEFNQETYDSNSNAGIEEKIIWDYFKKSPSNDKARCSICSAMFRVSTMNDLLSHLFLVHGISFPKHFKSKFPTDLRYNADQTIEYEFDNELTMDDISNINLSSIVHSEKNDCLKIINKKLKRRPNVMNKLWKHYTKLYRDKAMCNICDKTFAFKLGQTSGLVKHLQIQHKGVSVRNNKLLKGNNSSNVYFNSNLNIPRKKVNKTNIVWQFFTKIDDSKAQCDLCEHVNILYYSPRSRSNLLKHLRRKHKYFLDLAYNDGFKFMKDHNTATETKCESAEEPSGDTDNSKSGINMKALYDYFSADKNLQKCIRFEKEQIICKFCTGLFLCDDLLNFECTIKCHVQTCHADSSFNRSAFLHKNSNSARVCVESETSDELEIISNSSYNELEAISKEINSYGK